jgi:branched-chain amino acid transport system ATP-binding protein
MSLHFGGLQALKKVSLNLPEGQIVAIIGPNGAGKTSLLNCLAGTYKPSSGSACLDGVELLGLRADRRTHLGLARTFQNLGLVSSLTVLDNLLLGRHSKLNSGFTANALGRVKSRREERRARLWCSDLADFLGLTNVLRTPVAALPYGTRKRVDLGRALASEPTLLLLDEPVAGMDPHERQEIAELVAQLASDANRKMSMILVEHDVGIVMKLAQSVVVLDFGQVIAAGTPAAVQQHPEVIRAYLGGDLAGHGKRGEEN